MSLIATGGLGLLALGTLPGVAQSEGDTTPTSLASAADLQAERDRVAAAEAEKAKEVDAATAELAEVTTALETLKEKVATQAGRVEYANQELVKAEEQVVATQSELEATEAELITLEQQVKDVSIRAFVDGGAAGTAIFGRADPTDALRMDNMRAEVTRTDLDLLEDLKLTREDLEARRAEADDAVAATEALRSQAQAELAALEQDQQAQGKVAADANARLEDLLAEQASLAQIGEELENTAEIGQLADELAATPPAPPPPGDVPIPDIVTAADIAPAGKGIEVHVSIVDQVRQLLIDADAAGVNLGGGGYRSPEAQIATRRNNCGTSNYAIYEMPASDCSPPTARPGRSNHEKGLAIDFTLNGNLIRSRSGAGWNWLVANAARYGLENLPSEPWHWSVDGR